MPNPCLAAFGMDSARTKTHGRATAACQKGGMYPTFDSAAGSGEIPAFFGILPYLILRVTGFDSASGPIPGNASHWSWRSPLAPHLCVASTMATHTQVPSHVIVLTPSQYLGLSRGWLCVLIPSHLQSYSTSKLRSRRVGPTSRQGWG